MNIILFTYITIIIYTILKGYYLATAITIATIPFVLLLKKWLKNHRIKHFSKKIEEATFAHKKGLKYKPFMNINFEKWYILELIPSVDRVTAKRIANRAREQKFKSFEELANFANIEPAVYELMKKIILL